MGAMGAAGSSLGWVRGGFGAVAIFSLGAFGVAARSRLVRFVARLVRFRPAEGMAVYMCCLWRRCVMTSVMGL